MPSFIFLKKKKLRLQYDNQIDFQDLLPGGLSRADTSTGAKGCHFKIPSKSSERIKTAALIVLIP